MKKVQIKDCPLCGKIIWKFIRPKIVSITPYGIAFSFKRRPVELNEYGRHFWFLLTDGSRMMVAICGECLETLTDEQAKQIFADITFAKLEAIKKDKRKHLHYRLFDRIRTVELLKWFVTEGEVVNYIKELSGYKSNPAKSE